ncbi:MAG: saccharopine dehydrogenase NADP-binding domain-containing protein [Actinomycetia bacterium]|nr:saccharopine dehydrogenase NADP-binding domain-containing protein [Actinomycetes bacterium]
MRVIVLGATGTFGSQTVQVLAADERVTSVGVGCRDRARGAEVVATVGRKCVPVPGDLDSNSALPAALAAYDVVVNAAGPAYHYALRVAKAAIEAGKPCVDLCDDASASKAALELAERAEGAGVTVILGLGCSPGVTNLVAGSGSKRLDLVDAVHVVHGGTTESSLGGVANVTHLLDLIDGEISIVRDGAPTLVPGFSELEPYDFGAPLGVLRTGLIAHPEPSMFLRSFPGLREATVRLGLAPEIANDLLAASAAFGLTSDRPIRIGDSEIARREFLARHLHGYLRERAAASGSPESVTFAVHVIVEGVRESRPRRLIYRLYGDVSPLVSNALALGAIWLGEGRIHAPGVHTPEQCVDADVFLTELAARGTPGPQLDSESASVV